MAGTDGDLLKQATQAMMSRYDGEKISWLFSLHMGCEASRAYTSCFSGLALQLDGDTKSCTDLLCTGCARVFVRLRVLLSR